jgi:competence protein ComEC
MPLIPIVIVYISALAVGGHLAMPRTYLYIGIIALIFLSLVLSLGNRPILRTAAILLLFWLLGVLLIHIHLRPHFSPNHIFHYAGKGRLSLEGILYRRPVSSPGRTRLYVKVERIFLPEGFIKARGNALIIIKEYRGDLRYGDRIRFITKLKHPRNFNNPGRFNYRRFLACKGIWVTGYLKTDTGIATIIRGKGNIFFHLIEAWRDSIRTLLDQSVPTETRGIMKAIILGEREEIPQRVKEEFIVAGVAHIIAIVAHIIAISGLHMGIIALVIFSLARWSLRWSETITLTLDIHKLAAAITIPPLILYTFIAGARIPTIRAAIMIVIYLISILLDRQRNLYNTLGVAALVILLVSPVSLFDVSFQLSFVAVLAILYLVPRFSEIIPKPHPLLMKEPSFYRKLSGKFIDFALISVAAMVGTWPLVAYYFNRISFTGFLSNLIIVPLVGLIVPLGLITSLAVLICSPLGWVLAKLASTLSWLAIRMVHLFALIPHASHYLVRPTMIEIGLCYLLILYITNMRKMRRLVPVSILLFGAIAGDVSYWYIQTHLNKGLRITFMDVGRGDSILIEFPRGKRMLVDGGGFYDDSFDVGRNVVAPVLWEKKIATLHYLVLTHPHPDHLNGLKFIAHAFGVGEFWENGAECPSEPCIKLMETVRRRRIPRITVHDASPPRWINGVKVEVFNPSEHRVIDGREPWSQINNRSIVLKLIYKNHRFLLTGDIEEETEAQLVQSGKDLKADVLKVPHHGSQSSSTGEFLEVVKPSYAVFTVGFRKIFNLPNSKVLNRYEDLDCRILRTDADGAVTVTTDGKTLRVTTFLGKAEQLIDHCTCAWYKSNHLIVPARLFTYFT